MLSKQEKGGASASISPDNEGSSITDKVPKRSGKHSADIKTKCTRAVLNKKGGNRRNEVRNVEGQDQSLQ